MKAARFEDLFTEGLQELYDAENQILKALPKIIAAASSEALSEGLQEHLDQTKVQIRRLQSVFEAMGLTPGSSASAAMESLLNQADLRITDIEKSPVLDVALIGAAQKVEYYEIAAYGMARGLAELLGQQEAADLLQETLDEEEAAAKRLADIAEMILTGGTTVRGMSGA